MRLEPTNLNKLLSIMLKHLPCYMSGKKILTTKKIKSIHNTFTGRGNVIRNNYLYEVIDNKDMVYYYNLLKMYNRFIFKISIHFLKQMGLYESFLKNLHAHSLHNTHNISDYEKYYIENGTFTVIDSAFQWSCTKEGVIFWSNIEKKIIIKIKESLLNNKFI